MKNYLIILLVVFCSCKKDISEIDNIRNKIYDKKDYQGAIIALKGILNSGTNISDEDKAEIYYYIADSYLILGNSKLALENFNKFFKFTPDNNYLIEVAYLDRGEAKYNLEDYTGSVKDFNICVNMNPDDPTAYLSRGKSLAKLDMKESACEDFNNYITENTELKIKNGEILGNNLDFVSQESIEELNVFYKECNCYALIKIKEKL